MPVVHKITELYKQLYTLGQKINKRDKFGIHAKIENICLECLTLGIKSALSNKENKSATLTQLKLNTEVLKRLVRLENELRIIKEGVYFDVQKRLREISMMTSGWLKYTQKEP